MWQGATQTERKIHLANWEMICKPKKIGGLGIIELSAFNQALLVKWQWQWQSAEQRLWKGLFQTLHCTDNTNGVDNSYLFIAHLKEITQFCQCFFLRVQGRGDTVRFWDQDWGDRKSVV